ncbi:MAG: MarR family transcriptional regulator [Lachnospiraceae bacterium]|nr:MarR family transcriptional regulator [Lachnospiraceae bacterium]
MTKKEELSEALLDGWLSMSMSIWNERLVTAMTYNESMVCNQLYKQRCRQAEPLTATDLCARLQIRKPQMNVILNRLEKTGMIERVRSLTDKRNVHILLTEKGVPIYEKAHREILRLPEAVINRLGEEKIRTFAATMKEVAACFDEMMKE